MTAGEELNVVCDGDEKIGDDNDVDLGGVGGSKILVAGEGDMLY